MRKIVLTMSVSVDGYFEGPHHEIDWHLVDDELHNHFNDELKTMGAFLSGRITYELMAAFWPHADSDPEYAGPVAEFAGIWRDMPKIVYSRTLPSAGWNTTIARDIVVQEVRALKEQPGGDLALGGADVAATFMEHGLIDEYRLYVHPVLLGHGRHLFQRSDVLRELHLLETRNFTNGVVMLRYGSEPAGADR